MSDFDRFVRWPIINGDLAEVMQMWRGEYASERSGRWTALHWACGYTGGDRKGVVRVLLDRGCDIEAETEAGWRPLHICTSNDNRGAMRVLLEVGCCLTALARGGVWPLHIAEGRNHHECALMLHAAVQVSDHLEMLKNNRLYEIKDHETRKTLLDNLLDDNNQRILEAINNKQVDEQEMKDLTDLKVDLFYPRCVQLLRECLMYRCIHQGRVDGVYSLCNAETVNRVPLFMGLTALETAVNCGSVVWVHEILKKFVKVDESWSRLEDIAKQKGFSEIARMIINRRDFLHRKQKKGISRLHLAVIENDPDMVEYLLNRGATSSDESHKLMPQLSDVPTDSRSSNIQIISLTNHETIYSLCLKSNRTIYPCLLEAMDLHSVNRPDGRNNSLLHLSAVLLMPDLCSQLIIRSADVNAKNSSKSTPLLELLNHHYEENMDEHEAKFIETANVLIEGGASVDVEDIDECNVIEKATGYHNEKLLLTLIHKCEHLDRIKKPMWLAWISNKHYKMIREAIPRINKSLLHELITRDLIQDRLVDDDISLAKMMYDNGTYEVKADIVESMLYKAAVIGDKDLFKGLIKDDISEISALDGGESLLNCLIREGKTEFIQIIIISRNGSWFMEKKNAENKLPLHVCIECDFWDILDQLILETSSVNEEDVYGNTPLSLLLTKISLTKDEALIGRLMTSVKGLIKNAANIYLVNKHDTSVISCCMKSDLRLHIESFYRKLQSQQETDVSPQGAQGEPPVEVTSTNIFTI